VDRLEHSAVLADVRTGSDPQAADESGGEVADDVAVQVGQDEDVVQLRLLHELHAHVVDDPVLEFDPTVVLLRDCPAALEKEAVGQLHDVRLVDGGHLPAAVGDGVLEREAGNPLRRLAGDDLDALRRVPADAVLDACVQVLRVLADDHQVDVLVARLEPLDRAGRPQVRVQVEGLPEGHVDAPEAFPDRRRDRALDRHAIAPDRLEDVLRQWRPVALHDGLAGLRDLPVEPDTGRVEHAAGRLRQLRADPVAGDQGHSVGHASIVAVGGRRR
jgi:hypothetical protein